MYCLITHLIFQQHAGPIVDKLATVYNARSKVYRNHHIDSQLFEICLMLYEPDKSAEPMRPEYHETTKLLLVNLESGIWENVRKQRVVFFDSSILACLFENSSQGYDTLLNNAQRCVCWVRSLRLLTPEWGMSSYGIRAAPEASFAMQRHTGV